MDADETGVPIDAGRQSSLLKQWRLGLGDSLIERSLDWDRGPEKVCQVGFRLNLAEDAAESISTDKRAFRETVRKEGGSMESMTIFLTTANAGKDTSRTFLRTKEIIISLVRGEPAEAAETGREIPPQGKVKVQQERRRTEGSPAGEGEPLGSEAGPRPEHSKDSAARAIMSQPAKAAFWSD